MLSLDGSRSDVLESFKRSAAKFFLGREITLTFSESLVQCEKARFDLEDGQLGLTSVKLALKKCTTWYATRGRIHQRLTAI